MALGLALVSVAWHLWLIFQGLIPNLVSRPLHFALALPWLFFFAATKSNVERVSGWIIGGLGIGACLWVAINQSELGDQYGILHGPLQIAAGFVLLLAVLEGARRAIGWPLPLVALLALIYGLFGQHLPGEFGHSGMPLTSFLGTLTIAEGGLWGTLTDVSVKVVAIFVIFGAVLNAGEAGRGFMNLAAAAAGRLNGGAGKVSVISSALFGSISGSASANVASTGAITLPAMQKLGYPRSLAAAIEAVASSGGQIMPPLMGAGAFVMVTLTGVPYTSIIAAALLPAVLYFFAVWMGINAYARQYQLRGIDDEDRPALRDVALTAAFFLLPFTVLMAGMFALGKSPQYAAAMAILAGALLLLLGSDLKFSLKRTLERFDNALLTSARQIALIASIIVCASIVIGVLGITGLGIKITSLILTGSGGLLWPSLLLTALACLVLGMEVPTTAAYVICISVAGPALTQLGLSPLEAHLFVFWYALISTITPPVCGAVFIAAGMIEENWLKVALKAMALGVGLYVIPLGMIANPALIRLETDVSGALLAFAQMCAALACISWALIAVRRPALKILLLLPGLAIVFWRLLV
ncbi:MAG: TRAP transporter fused permease subunit [Gammaproteobacteria bacterium]|nr:TRAP transporter fused permease subunit [Gammaproteobacteria bacterium]